MKKDVGKVFDVHDYMSETTVDILLGEAFGFFIRRTTLLFIISNLLQKNPYLVIKSAMYSWETIEFSETAMGHKRMGDNDDGFKYAMAVMK